MAVILFIVMFALGVEFLYHLHGVLIYGDIASAGGETVHRNGRKWSLSARLWLLCGVAGLLWLTMLNARFQPVVFVVAAIFAILPLPIHITLIHWLDRMEPEPPKLIVGAFLWGATVAAVISAISNDAIAGMAGYAFDDPSLAKTFVTSRVAPVVEETAKGIALLILFRLKRNEFDDIVDGIVYAAMIGLGFAMSENILYYGKWFTEHGATGLAVVFGMRGVVSPYAHPLFTSMTGIGLGIAAQTSKKWLRWFAPLAGFILAIFLHGLWNTEASAGWGFVMVYALIMVPVFIVVAVLLRFSIRREARILRQYLGLDLREGRLSQPEYDEVCSTSWGLRSAWRCFTQKGFKASLQHRRFQLLAKELAFHRYRTAVQGRQSNPEAAQREATYLAHLGALRWPPTPPILAPPRLNDGPSVPV